MSSVPVFVGLDYHQDNVQVCVVNSEGKVLANRSVSNDASTIELLSCRHGVPQRMAIEACCGAADLAEVLATQWRLPVQLAHPGYVNRMKQSPDKTDFNDAHLLADLARVNYVPKVWLAPRETRELRRLVRHRGQLVARRKDIKLRIRALLRENRLKYRDARAWTQAWCTWLTEQAELSESDRWVLEDHLAELISLTGRIAAVEAKIHIRIKDDPIVKRLLQEPGVGFVTAVTLRAEVGRFDRFCSGKQLARFCGVTPRNASSGARQADAGLIKAGNPALRVVLIELGHRLINQAQGDWAILATKMLIRGKPKNVVVAAIANRWVRRLYHQMQSTRASDVTSAPALQKGAAPFVSPIAST
jgi:transposase